MRQTYETDRDRSNQEAAISFFAKHFGWDWVSMPPKSPFDYAVIKSPSRHISGFVEVKCRNIEYGQYPDIMLSWHKLREACVVGKPVALLVRWSDRLGWCLLDDSLWDTLEWGGRTSNTRDAWDEEPVIKIPNKNFRMIPYN